MEKPNSRLKYGRRRSRSLGGILNARDICKTIKKSLPSPQKLQLLLQYALENSLSMAEKDLCEDIDDDIFRKEISNCQINIESEIEEMNYCSMPIADKESNNGNVSMGMNHAEYSSAVAKFEEESKQWDELLVKYRDNCEKEKEMEEIHFNGQFDLEKYQHLDYSTIWKDVKSVNSNLNYQIAKLTKKNYFLSRYVKLLNKGISCWSRVAGKTFKKTIVDSPRKLIKICF